MPADPSLLAAFFVGLMGGVHCAGMCAGIVGALTAGAHAPWSTITASPRWSLQLAYNGGRLSSYIVAGALMGGIGSLATQLTDLHAAQQMLQVIAAVFMVALGLYLGGWWYGLTRIEHAGGRLWRRIEPLGRRFIPVRGGLHAYALGLVWGWLPCGLVYSVLVWCISAGDALRGSLLMASFGIGTLPTLLALGAAANASMAWVRSPGARTVAGLLVIAFGAYTLAMALR